MRNYINEYLWTKLKTHHVIAYFMGLYSNIVSSKQSLNKAHVLKKHIILKIRSVFLIFYVDPYFNLREEVCAKCMIYVNCCNVHRYAPYAKEFKSQHYFNKRIDEGLLCLQ